MRILLDHCLDWRLKRHLRSHAVRCASDMGWERLTNGALLAAASSEFDVLITADQNLAYQQNPGTLPIAVLVLLAKSSKLADLLPLAPAIESALKNLRPNAITEVALP